MRKVLFIVLITVLLGCTGKSAVQEKAVEEEIITQTFLSTDKVNSSEIEMKRQLERNMEDIRFYYDVLDEYGLYYADILRLLRHAQQHPNNPLTDSEVSYYRAIFMDSTSVTGAVRGMLRSCMNYYEYYEEGELSLESIFSMSEATMNVNFHSWDISTDKWDKAAEEFVGKVIHLLDD